MSTLVELLAEDAIGLDATASDWRDAITQVGDLLVASGVSDGAYTRSMIENVEQNGPYIVVAPGFAFAHARPSEAVHRTGLAWLRLAEPVEFGSPNDPVTLVVALAALESDAHRQAMAQLATVIGSRSTKEALDAASTPAEVLEILGAAGTPAGAQPAAANPAAAEPAHQSTGPASKGKVLTVCGNGLGTSLFLKNTLEQVLDRWGWSRFLSVEATDTISAKGKAKEADFILTSGEIAKTLGDVGVPVKVIANFTSTDELDAAMRELYDI